MKAIMENALAIKTEQINALVEALRELEPAALRLSQLTNMANKEPGAPASEWHATRQAIDRARTKARAAIKKATEVGQKPTRGQSSDALEQLCAYLSASAEALAACRKDAEQLTKNRDDLFFVLFEFHSAFWNRGETTSLKEWNDRLKKVDNLAQQLLEPNIEAA